MSLEKNQSDRSSGSRKGLSIKAHLRDEKTGFSSVHEAEAKGYGDPTHALYHWTEGNYGCDCNRSLFLWELDLNDDRELDCNREHDQIRLDKLIIGEEEFTDDLNDH